MHLPPPMIAVAFIALMFVLGWLFPALEFEFGGQRLIGGMLLVFGIGLVAIAGKSFFEAKTTILPDKIDKSSTLVTDGIYKYTRNPMYLGMAIVIVGAGLGAGNWLMPLAVAGFVMVINKIQIAPEEAGLARIFGQDYADFCAKTRRWV